jgi:hypothetical protein
MVLPCNPVLGQPGRAGQGRSGGAGGASSPPLQVRDSRVDCAVHACEFVWKVCTKRGAADQGGEGEGSKHTHQVGVYGVTSFGCPWVSQAEAYWA